MTRNTIINKYGKPLAFLTNLTSILLFVLTIFGFIPSEVKGNLFFKIAEILVLILGLYLLFPILNGFLKSKSKMIAATGYCFVTITFILLFASVVTQKNLPAKADVLAINNFLYNSPNSSTENIAVKHKKIEILNSPITTGDHSPVIIGDGNKIEQNNYSTPRQRRLNKKDLQELKAIPFTNTKIQLLYPSGNNEASTFGDEIFSKLFDLGHTNLSKGTIDFATYNSANERFTIVPRKELKSVINVIVNPQ